MPQTRAFTKLGATVPFLISAAPGNLVRIQGYCGASTPDLYLQLHDVAATGSVATGTILASFNQPGASPYSWSFDPSYLHFSTGIVAALSTAETTYVASSVAIDYLGEIEEFEGRGPMLPAGYVTAGDLSTGVDNLTVWATLNENRSLYQIDFVNNDGANRYLMAFATTAAATVPVIQWGPVTNGSTLTLKFGHYGRQFFDGTFRKCFLAQSSTAGVLTVTSSAASYMRAYYI